jgi:hypothetical protein
MKKIKTLLFLSALLGLTACTKDKTNPAPAPSSPPLTIPNADFENWDNLPKLQTWKTNSCPVCVPPYETYVVQKDTAACYGQFSAKFIYNNVYSAIAENKFAASVHPSFLDACVKCNLSVSDSVFIRIEVLHAGVVTDQGEWYGTTSINNFIPVSIPVSQNSSQVDSVLITIRGGQKNAYPGNNTEFWVDNLSIR